MSKDEKYNGWTNYETWRVNLEIFDGMTRADICESDDMVTVSEACKEMAHDMVDGSSEEGLARDFARAFLSHVNWYEIARSRNGA